MKALAQQGQLQLNPAESQWHDLLRLFLLLQVMFGHMAAIALPTVPQLANEPAENWPSIIFRLMWRFGPQAAFLFVFLSGFMVAGPLLASTWVGQVPCARTFFAKRLLRIVPISVGAVLFTALLDILSRLSPGAEALYSNSYAYDMVGAFSWMNFIGNVLFLQPVGVDSFGSNGPLWTLGYIVQFYVIGWVCCRIYVSSRARGFLVLACILVLMAAVRAEWAVLFVTWLIGGFARQFHVLKRLRVLFLLLGCVLFVVSNLFGSLIAAASSIAIGCLLTVALRHLPLVSWMDGKGAWLRRLSNDSYAVYAIHHPVLMFVYAVMFVGAAGPNSRFFLYVTLSVVMTMVATLVLKGLLKLINPELGSSGSKEGYTR